MDRWRKMVAGSGNDGRCGGVRQVVCLLPGVFQQVTDANRLYAARVESGPGLAHAVADPVG